MRTSFRHMRTIAARRAFIDAAERVKDGEPPIRQARSAALLPCNRKDQPRSDQGSRTGHVSWKHSRATQYRA